MIALSWMHLSSDSLSHKKPGEVQGSVMEGPLLGGGGVVCLAKADRTGWAELGPFLVGLGEDVRGRLEEVGIGPVGTEGEMCGQEVGRW